MPEQRTDCEFARYENLEDVPQKVLAAVIAHQGEKAWAKDKQEMQDRSVLWVAYVDGEVAGVRHSRRACHFRRWFVPLDEKDLVIFRGRAFPEFRGRGISPSMMRHIMVTELVDGGAAYVDCAMYNRPSIRSIQKAGFEQIATMKTIRREWALYE